MFGSSSPILVSSPAAGRVRERESDMAEMGKGVTAGKLASNVQKRFSRAQEKVRRPAYLHHGGHTGTVTYRLFIQKRWRK